MSSQRERGKGHAGWRSMIRSWLIEHGMSPEDADAWLDAWERQPRERWPQADDSEYWQGAAVWIVEQRKTRKLPR